MNHTLSQEGTRSTWTSKIIDNTDLYEAIGNLVIERAELGDRYCFEIFSKAYRKVREARTWSNKGKVTN